MKVQMKQLITMAWVITLTGCGPQSMTVKWEASGVTYEMPFQKQVAPEPPSSEVLRGIDGTTKTNNLGFTFFGEKYTIKELDGNLTVNGKDYGSVKKGDKVRIDKAGNVAVNGTSRPPR